MCTTGQPRWKTIRRCQLRHDKQPKQTVETQASGTQVSVNRVGFGRTPLRGSAPSRQDGLGEGQGWRRASPRRARHVARGSEQMDIGRGVQNRMLGPQPPRTASRRPGECSAVWDLQSRATWRETRLRSSLKKVRGMAAGTQRLDRGQQPARGTRHRRSIRQTAIVVGTKNGVAELVYCLDGNKL
jgi:hypothetical protein